MINSHLYQIRIYDIPELITADFSPKFALFICEFPQFRSSSFIVPVSSENSYKIISAITMYIVICKQLLHSVTEYGTIKLVPYPIHKCDYKSYQ